MIKKEIERADLSFLGVRGQAQLVKSIIEDTGNYVNYAKLIDFKAFTEPTLKAIVKYVDDYYTEKGILPSYNVIELFLRNNAKDGEEMAKAREIFQQVKSDDLFRGMEESKEYGLNFFKAAENKRLFQKYDKKFAKGIGYSDASMTEYISELQNILRNNVNNEGGAMGSFFDNIMGQRQNEYIDTGIHEIDEALRGGFRRGKVALLIGGTGIGKTTFVSILGASMAVNGHKVLHITFEDSCTEIAEKYYAHYTGKPYNTFNEKTNKEEYRKLLFDCPKISKAINENLNVQYMINGCTTVEDIENKINSIIAQGWKPDMVFIDYLSCLQLSSDKKLATTNEWQCFERAMKKLEAYAKAKGILIFTSQQTNVNAFKTDTKENRLANVQGSFRITQPCSYIFSIQREGDTSASIYLDKNRYGELRTWEKIYFNWSTCQFDLSNSEIETKENLAWEED